MASVTIPIPAFSKWPGNSVSVLRVIALRLRVPQEEIDRGQDGAGECQNRSDKEEWEKECHS
jgi:hypothetical protein